MKTIEENKERERISGDNRQAIFQLIMPLFLPNISTRHSLSFLKYKLNNSIIRKINSSCNLKKTFFWVGDLLCKSDETDSIMLNQYSTIFEGILLKKRER